MRRTRVRGIQEPSRVEVRAARATWVAPLAAALFASACLAWFAGPRSPAAEFGVLEPDCAAHVPADVPVFAPSRPLAPWRRVVEPWSVEECAALEAPAIARSEAAAPDGLALLVERTRGDAPPAPRAIRPAPRAPAPASVPARAAAPSAKEPPAAPAAPGAKAPPSAPAKSPPRVPPARPAKPAPPRDELDYPRGIWNRFAPGGAGVPRPGSAGATPGGGGGGGPTSGNPGGGTSGATPPSVPRAFERSGARGEHPGLAENPFELTRRDATSTFSIDVDTASYALARRFLAAGVLPPREIVRIEEFLNTFRYDDPAPDGDEPLAVHAEVASCPWAPAHALLRVGLRGRDLERDTRAGSNLVFLIDVSGSMDAPEKLPLLVSALKLLVQQLDGRDTLAIVTYAGASGLVLPATSCDHQRVIANALDALASGGATNGSAGIELAYQIAAANFTRTGQNRVILCTDGDFNLGTTSLEGLQQLIERERASGVFLSVLGFGPDGADDATMELLADKGDGNYAFIDTFAEARKVLAREFGSTLVTVAKDVKLQIEFDRERVQAWRLVGYENRVLADADFDDDRKDAGEIGAGKTVTALYELVPVGVAFDGAEPGPDAPAASATAFDGELAKVRLRYKRAGGELSQFRTTVVRETGTSWQDAGAEFQFAAAVAAFGLQLRGSAYAGTFTLRDVLNLAVAATSARGRGADEDVDRAEFVELVRAAQRIASGAVH